MYIEPHAFIRVAVVGEHAAVCGVLPSVAVVGPGALIPQVAPLGVGVMAAGEAAFADLVQPWAERRDVKGR